MIPVVEELVDGGLQTSDGHAGVAPEWCVRAHRGGAKALKGHGFCEACLAWLRCESDVDPLDAGDEVAKPQVDYAADPWEAYVALLMGGGYG
jgi:hypothetical protein